MGWNKIETQRLNYFKFNQKKIKADTYSGLQDAISANDNLNNVGKRIILPPSFHGGPRFFREKFYDAMAIVQHKGKPHIFLTVTANSKWPEVQESLLKNEAGENVETNFDRPDLTVRVFQMRLTKLIEVIKKGHIFGRVVAIVYTTEFQKRGMFLITWI
jgi:hypothetical protein